MISFIDLDDDNNVTPKYMKFENKKKDNLDMYR